MPGDPSMPTTVPTDFNPHGIWQAWAATYPDAAPLWDPFWLAMWLTRPRNTPRRADGTWLGPYPAWPTEAWADTFARAAAEAQAENAAVPTFTDQEIELGAAPGVFRVARKPWRCVECRGLIARGERHFEYLGSAEPYSAGDKYHRACAARAWRHLIYEATRLPAS
jgi:hypothetical protein